MRKNNTDTLRTHIGVNITAVMDLGVAQGHENVVDILGKQQPNLFKTCDRPWTNHST